MAEQKQLNQSVNKEAAALIGLLFLHSLLLVAFYYPALSLSADFYFEDITHFFEPYCRFIGQTLAKGELPLWNPLSYCGMPQAAVSSPGIFFPFNWLFAFVPFSFALAVIMIVHQLLAGVSVYFYARFFELPRAACVFAGSIICLSGYLFGFQNNFTLVATAAWFSCAMSAFIYLSRAMSVKRNILLTLLSVTSIYMTIAGGRPEIFVPGFALLFLQSAVLSFHFGEKPSVDWTVVVRLVRASFIGVLLAMPAILPAAEWVPWSRRSEGLFAGEVLLFSASWYDFLSMILVQPLGDLQRTDAPLLGLTMPVKLMPYLPSAYLGSSVFILAIWGVFAGSRKRLALTLSAIACLFFVLAVGANLPSVSTVVESLNLLSLLRFPIKLLLFSVLCLSILAALGANEFLTGRARILPTMIFSMILLLGGIMLSMCGHTIVLPFEQKFVTEEQRKVGQELIAQSLLLNGCMSLVINALAGFSKKNPRYRGLTLGTIFAVSVVCLIINANIGCAKFTSKFFFSRPSELTNAIADLKRESDRANAGGRLLTVYMESFTRSPRVVWETKPDANSYQYDRQIMFPNDNYDFDIPHVYGFEGAMVGEYFYYLLNTYIKSNLFIPEDQVSFVSEIKSKARDPEFGDKSDLPLYRFLQACSCDYVTTQKDVTTVMGKRTQVQVLDANFFELVREIGSLNLRLYRVKQAMPRAYLMPKFTVCESRDKLIDTMFFAEKNGFSAERECLLENKPDFKEESVDPSIVQGAGLILRDPSNSKVCIDAPVALPSILVLTDQYYPGWKVYVDGVEDELLRVNGFFRGVALPAGRHDVVFVYEPASLRNAFLLAVCGLLWLALWIAQSMTKTTD